MKTEVIKISAKTPDPQVIGHAASIIKNGGLVAFPTETVYGLGANALDSDAVRKIFHAKNRPVDNPVILHIGNIKELNLYAASICPEAYQLTKTFWPGPLTLVLNKTLKVPAVVTADMDTVCIRMPQHLVALALIEASGVPIAAPSANVSTRPSPTHASHVIEDLDGKVDLILDAGPVEVGIESTIVDMTHAPFEIVRPGGVTREQLMQAAPQAAFDYSTHANSVVTPGMKYKHYAPVCAVWVYKGDINSVQSRVLGDFQEITRGGVRVRILSSREVPHMLLEHQRIFQHDDQFAAELYEQFRQAETDKIDVLFIVTPADKGIGKAINNRLEKAASKIVTCV